MGSNITYRYQGVGFRDWHNKLSLLDDNFVLELFERMLRIRLIEEEIESQYHLDQMKTPIHLVIGQEATAVGACAALNKNDLVFSGHRTHGAYLGRGGDLKRMLCEMYCKLNGCAGSRGGSMHLIDPSAGMAWSSAIVGGSIPIATGAALAAKMRGENQISMVFLGDGGTEEGVCSESLNFAALKKLPIIFFCENNFYSVQSPLGTRQPRRNITRWAAGHALNAIAVDGTNVLDVYKCVSDAVKNISNGGGPWFIEAKVYRFRAHGGAYDDSKSGYREIAEVQHWEGHCPVESYFHFLKEKSLIDDKLRQSYEKKIKTEIKEAFEFAMSSPEPTRSDLELHVYAD